MKTGCTSGKKNFVFTFHSVCTVFVLFKMGHFQSPLIVRDLHNHKRLPYMEIVSKSTSPLIILSSYTPMKWSIKKRF